MRLLFCLGAVAALAAAPTHRAAPPPVAVASVDTVDVTPAQDTLVLRTYDRVYARVVDSIGRRKSATVTWTVRDTLVLYISGRRTDSTGFYSAGLRARSDTGRTYVVAQAGSKKDSALWVVRDTTCSETTLASINLWPDSATAHRTDSIGTAAIPRNTCGHVLMKNLTWSSSDSTKALIDRLDSTAGRIRVLDSGPGTVYIKGVSGTVRDSVKVKYKHAP
jgi:uncharacterized protein YjdB